MRRVFGLLVFFVFVSVYYSYSFSEIMSQLLAQNTVIVGIFRPDDRYVNSVFPYYQNISNYVDTNGYVLLNIDDNFVPVVYLPISVDWNVFKSLFTNSQNLSDVSFILPEGMYVKKEISNYIVVLDSRFMNNYNNQKKGVGIENLQILSNFVDELSKSNLSGVLVKPTSQLLRSFLSLNIKSLDDRYNFLIDTDYVLVFLNDNQITGRVFLKNTSKVSNVFLPFRERSRIQIPNNIQFYVGLSINPRIVVDLLEVFSPDVVATFPSLRRDIVNSFSGSIFLSLKSPIYSKEIDVISILGLKSQKEADKLLKSLLGIIGKYKVITVANTRVIELDFSGQNLYVALRDKDMVISTKKESLENYILSSRRGELGYINLPTLGVEGKIDYVAVITDVDKQNFRKNLGVEPPNFLKLSLEVDSSLKFLYFEFIQN